MSSGSVARLPRRPGLEVLRSQRGRIRTLFENTQADGWSTGRPNQSVTAPVQGHIPHNVGGESIVVLGDFEQLVLLAVLRLNDEAYGARLRQEIHARSGRDVSINAVYTTLDRLERKGLLKSWTGDPAAERGGRRRKFYALRPAGITALRQAYRTFTAMADGLERQLDTK